MSEGHIAPEEKNSMCKCLIAAALIVCGLVHGARPASAQTPVVDHSNLLQNIKTALQTAQLVTTTASQLQVMEAQLQYQIQNLKTIDPTSITGLINGINQVQMTFATLQGDINSIGYTANMVSSNFNRLFPKNQKQWQGTPYSSFNGYYDNWNAEITSSSLAAVRAQTVISTLDANGAAIQRALLTADRPSTGEIQQLQIVNQQLALIHTELANLVQNLATLGRVVTDYAVASAGTEEMSRERRRLRLQNYTYRGLPAVGLSHVP
jgi:P-type conjugative transfer protein TrbJ